MNTESIVFEDEYGKILSDAEINRMSPWEIEQRKIHVYEDAIYSVEMHRILNNWGDPQASAGSDLRFSM